jgi:hypothetical protein
MLTNSPDDGSTETAIYFSLFNDEGHRCLLNVEVRKEAMFSLPVAVSHALYGREPRVGCVYRARMASKDSLTVRVMVFGVVTHRIVAVVFVFRRETQTQTLCTSSLIPQSL